MTRDDEFIGQLEGYLDEYEGMTPLPDAVRNAVRAELPSTRQIGWLVWPMRRFHFMNNNFVRFGLAAAAIALVIIVGIQLLPGPRVGSDASPTPSPAATGALSLLESPTSGNLPPGRYYLDLPAYPGRIEFQVPAGWWHWWDSSAPADATANGILVDSLDGGATNGSAWGLSFTLVGGVLADPCDPTAGFMDSSVTESADSLAAAFALWGAFPVTSSEDVTVSGFAGKRVEIARGADATCAGTLFDTPSGYHFAMELPSSEPIVNQFTFLDVQGSVLVIWTTDFPGTTLFEEGGGASPDPKAHVEDQVQLHGILDSIVIEPH